MEKQLVIGGLEKVFEIGKQFRNEGVDTTHNPEFTTCEFYQAYATYTDLMILTEELLSGMAKEILGTPTLQVISKSGEEIAIDLSPPFRRIDLIPELEKCLGTSLPDVNDEGNTASAPSHLSFRSQVTRTMSIPRRSHTRSPYPRSPVGSLGGTFHRTSMCPTNISLQFPTVNESVGQEPP